MKKLFTLIAACLFSVFCVAQNLVPNPSFEEYDTCPASTVTNLIELSTGWQSFRGSPNYFNECVDESFPLWDMPNNGFGSQHAYSGNAFAGLYTYGNPPGGSENYREFIGTELSEQLTPGTKYFVLFKVVRATNGFYYNTNWANNKIGVLFSSSAQYTNTGDSLLNNAQVYADSLVSDTANWTSIKGSFFADSAYKFITIGNLFEAERTNAVSLGSPSLGAYYYIDDVCISTDSNYCANWTHTERTIEKNQVKVFPNPANDYLYIDDSSINFDRIQMIDCIGRVILSQPVISNGLMNEIYVKDLSSGLYTVILLNAKQSYRTTLLITH